MEKWLYMMFIEKTKTYNRLTKAAVERHVANLRELDDNGHLELAVVLRDIPAWPECISFEPRVSKRPENSANRNPWWWRALPPIS